MTGDPGSDPAERYPDRSGGDWTVADWAARRARTAPESTAVIDATTGERWTYADLDARVSRCARRLAALGIRPGDHLGTLAGTRTETPVLVHAAARVGAVLVPLNARLPADQVRRQADRADVTALVCERSAEDLATAAAAERSIPVASLDEPADSAVAELDAVDPGSMEDEDEDELRSHRWSLGDPQAILFTSGTTGEPKAVVLTAGNLLASAVASAFRLGVTPGDRWLCELPAYHMGGIAPFYRSAVYGTTAVVQERGPEGFDAELTVRNCREYDATGISLVPTQLDRILDVADGRVCESLRFVLLGGGPAPDDLVRRCGDRGVPVCPTYGMTETASQIATATPDEAIDHVGTVGRPLAVTDVTVVDAAGDPLPTGETGELVVDGPTVTPGYYGYPDATAAAFGEYGLHTGDRGYRDQGGRLYVLGRRTDRIVTGGENVDPDAVRDAILDVAGVEDAAVVGIEDEEWGERVGALVVRSDADLDADDVVDGVRDRLADYERPRAVGFAEALPRTASGTVERDAVRERLRDAGIDV